MAVDNFKHLVLAHYEAMYRVAYAILRDSDDAQDAVQDAVAAIWSRRLMLNAIDNYQAFCLRAVRNRCIDMIRSRSSRPSPWALNPETDMPESDMCHDPIDLAASIEANDTLTVVKELISKLPPMQQQVIKLRSEAGCDFDEIAALTGISNENARTLLSRARRKLKELYSNIK